MQWQCKQVQYECDSDLALIFIVEFDWWHQKMLVCCPVGLVGMYSSGCTVCTWFRLIGEHGDTGTSQLYKGVAILKIAQVQSNKMEIACKHILVTSWGSFFHELFICCFVTSGARTLVDASSK